MKIGTRIKTIAMISAVMITSLSICGCGSNMASNTPTATAVPENALGDAYPGNYQNYVSSFTEEFGQFVDGDMTYILKNIGTLNSSNYLEWKEKYTNALERTEHWYNEVDTAIMFCPTEKTESHNKMTSTAATIYKVMQGLESRVAAADAGDFSELTSMGEDYIKANGIVHDMWNETLEEVK